MNFSRWRGPTNVVQCFGADLHVERSPHGYTVKLEGEVIATVEVRHVTVSQKRFEAIVCGVRLPSSSNLKGAVHAAAVRHFGSLPPPIQ